MLVKPLLYLAFIALCSSIHADYLPGQSSVFINGQEYRPVQSDYYQPSSPAVQTHSSQALETKENCWYEQVPLQNQEIENSVNAGGAIVGGIIGGIIGHQFGSGSGNTAATIGGAVIGATLGSTPTAPTQHYQTIRKCNTIK